MRTFESQTSQTQDSFARSVRPLLSLHVRVCRLKVSRPSSARRGRESTHIHRYSTPRTHFEKLRIKDQKPRSRKREEMKRIQKNRMDREKSSGFWRVGRGETVTID